MKKFLVIVKFPNGKEARYIAPSTSDTHERAVFDVATLWPFDFKCAIESVKVEVMGE